jgi:hemin uptake protein HemP
MKSLTEDPALTDQPQQDDAVPGSDRLARREDSRKVWNSEDLLGSESEAVILHRGQEYRLRCTRQGKLILFK